MPAHLDPLHGKEPADFSQASCLERFAAQKARWLVIRRFKEWDEKEREELATIRQASETAETLSLLVQQFFQLVRKWQGDRLDAWLTAVAPSQIEERQRFAHGREQEKAAVLMGLTHSPPHGQAQGQGTRIQRMKSRRDGRAGFPLLRQRVLPRFSDLARLTQLAWLKGVLLSQSPECLFGLVQARNTHLAAKEPLSGLAER